MINLRHRRPRRVVGSLAAALALPCAVASSLPAHAVTGGGVADNGFTAPVVMPGSHGGEEPSIAVDSHGRIFISPTQLSTPSDPAVAPNTFLGSPVWRSSDGGASFQGPVQAVGDPVNGLDTSLALDAKDDLYQADLWLGNVAMAVSTDAGQSFIANQAANLHGGADRPWLAYSRHDNVLYELYNGLDALHVARSAPLLTPAAGLAFPVDEPVVTSCGVTSTSCASPPFDQDCGCPPGGIAVDQQTGEVFITYGGGSDGGVGLAYSTDQGLTWTKTTIPGSGGSGNGFNVAWNFQPIAVDSQGNVDVAWGETVDPVTSPSSGLIVATGGVRIRFSRSTDHGLTWSAPVTASTTTGTNIFPALAVGKPGTVYVGYYAVDGGVATDPGLLPDTASWDLVVSTSRDALESTPQFEAETAVAGVHDGCVESGALVCPQSTNGSGFGDFFSMAVGPDGRVDIAYVAGDPGSTTTTVGTGGVGSTDTVYYPDTYVYFTSHAG